MVGKKTWWFVSVVRMHQGRIVYQTGSIDAFCSTDAHSAIEFASTRNPLKTHEQFGVQAAIGPQAEVLAKRVNVRRNRELSEFTKMMDRIMSVQET